jgi:hypothetical protein
MTTKRTAQPSSGLADHFPERPPRRDMQNWIHIGVPGHLSALVRHLGNRDTTIAICEPALGWNLSQRTGLLYPDLLVSFNADRAHAFARLGYAMDVHGKPPEFVLEVASVHTALNDYTTKRVGYAAFGVQEYWRFDPTGGERYPAGLAGDRLVDGEYQPTTVAQVEEGEYRGHSEVLNLDLCWEHGQLRWFDPVSQRYLLTHDDDAEGRIAAEAQLDVERQARVAAEARVRQLEEELRRRSQ